MRGTRGFNGVYSGSDIYFIYESDRTKTWKMIAEEEDFSSSSGPHNAAKRFAVAFDLPWPLPKRIRNSLGRKIYEAKERNPHWTWAKCLKKFRPEMEHGLCLMGSISCNRAKAYAKSNGRPWPITQISSDRSSSS
jgi:hypothetical protein